MVSKLRSTFFMHSSSRADVGSSDVSHIWHAEVLAGKKANNAGVYVTDTIKKATHRQGAPPPPRLHQSQQLAQSSVPPHHSTFPTPSST
jgi:hypothetical protein